MGVQRLLRNCGLGLGLERAQKGFWDEAGLKRTVEKKQRRHLGEARQAGSQNTCNSVTVWSGRTVGNVGFSPQATERLEVSLGKERMWMRARLPLGGRAPGKYVFVESMSIETT